MTHSQWMNQRLRLRTPRSVFRFVAALTALFLLGACNYSGAPKADKNAISAWIDKPLNNSTHVLGPIEVLAHGAAYDQIAQLELSVEGDTGTPAVVGASAPEVVNVKAGGSAKTAAVLGRTQWVWTPAKPGEYILHVRAQNADGTWSADATAHVTVVLPDLPLGGLTEPLPQPGEILQPIPLSTATATATATPTSTLEAACTDQAKFIADITIPDNTNIDPGAPFTKTWRVQNSGTCAWNENYKVVFFSGSPLSNPTPVSIPGIVAPGGTVDLSLDLVAPGSPGTYTSSYKIQNPQGVQFGVGSSGNVPFYVQIVVGATATPAPTGDSQPPSGSISHSPSGSSLPENTTVTFTANGSDNIGVARIEIVIQIGPARGSVVKTCNNAATCSYSAAYPANTTLNYSARIYDAAGNQAIATGQTINFYVVIK